MSIIFISHSSKNNVQAVEVRDWLIEKGWNEVFLDLDPAEGLAPGQQWRDELKRAGELCAAVIVLITPDWAASKWCLTEFMVASQLGKRIFPVLLQPTALDDLPPELTTDYQLVDISTPDCAEDGFERLKIGIRRAGLDPKYFPWPPPDDPQRHPYRGLHALAEADAAIFFGRDAVITKGLDALRRMQGGTTERILTIVGASGAGKSSFLRAGLIARLRRDSERFLALPIVRPENAALTGAQGLLAALELDVDAARDHAGIGKCLAALRAPVMERLSRLAAAAGQTYRGSPPTIVISIDQGEELFNAENDEAIAAIELLEQILTIDDNSLAMMTIRSDSLLRLQDNQRLAATGLQLFNLPALPAGAFKEVITGPAKLNEPKIVVEDALVDRLIRDLDRADALPLLAFTMQRLYEDYGDDYRLELHEYTDQLGGLAGAIDKAVCVAFDEARKNPALPDTDEELRKLARRAFIPWLVQVDDPDSPPKRRVARMSELAEAGGLVASLVDQRLLTTTTSGDGIAMVEVAHEAILRNWRPLVLWIGEERERLRTLNTVQIAAREWRENVTSGDEQGALAWLVHSNHRLNEAEALLARDDYAQILGADGGDYIAACRKAEDARQAHELALRTRRRFWQRIATVVVVAGALVTAAGFLAILDSQRDLSRQVSRSLAAEARAEFREYRYDRAMRLSLAASRDDLLHAASIDAALQVGRAAHFSRLQAELTGHSEAVFDAAYSPDGSSIVTASEDNTARVWRADERGAWGSVVLTGHEGPVLSAAFSPDGSRIVTASDDNTARVWRADERGEWTSRTLTGHDSPVVLAVFSPDGTRIVTASDDGTARVWREDSDAAWSSVALADHDAAVLSAAFSPDGASIVTASDDSTARLWREDDNGLWSSTALAGHDGPVVSALFSSDGSRLVTASWDKTARVWREAQDGAWSSVALPGHEGSLESAAFSPDGLAIVTASRDGQARVWLEREGGQWSAAILTGHEGEVWSAAFSPDGSRIVTASDDYTARLWYKLRPGRSWSSVVLAGHDGPILSAAFSPDGSRIVTASEDYSVRVWRVDQIIAWASVALAGHDDGVMSAAFAPDGSGVVTASLDGTARVWRQNPDGAWRAVVLAGHDDAVLSAAFSRDGSRIVTASADNTARVWRKRQDGKWSSPVILNHQDLVSSAAFSPDGSRIVTASWDNTARVWREGADGNWSSVILSGHVNLVSSAAFSPDGLHVVTASKDGKVRVWRDDQNGGWSSRTLSGHENWVRSARFSPDGRAIVSASVDGTARVWRQDQEATWSSVVLEDHDGEVWSAAFSADGTRIVTASSDNTARVWREDEDGVWSSVMLTGHALSVQSAEFSPDGSRIVTASLDGTARVWDAAFLMSAGEWAASRLESLPAAVCKNKLVGTASVVKGQRVSVRRLNQADIDAAPILAGRAGEDVCAPFLK